MADPARADISMHRIPVRGGWGTGVLIALIVLAIVADLPQLREPVAAGVLIGVLVAAVKIARRHGQGLSSEPPSRPTLL